MNESLENSNSCSFPMAHGIPLIAINFIICVLGSLGNFLVCLAITTNSRLRRASNYLLFSLAIADLIVTLVCEPLLLKVIIQRTFFHECTEWLQRTYSLLSQISCSTSVYHMVAISFDRFVAVVFPLRHRNFIEGCGLKLMLIISWSIPILGRVLRAIVPPATYPGHFFWIGSFCLELFLYFLFLFSNRGISDPLQKEKKATRCPNTFCESDFQQGGPCCLHTGYRNWRFHGLLGSSDDCILCRWKTNYKSKRLSTHVAPNPSSVQLSHELSDLLC